MVCYPVLYVGFDGRMKDYLPLFDGNVRWRKLRLRSIICPDSKVDYVLQLPGV
jgi:hypothetical protein